MSSYFFVIIYNLFFYIFSFLLLINYFSLSNFLFLINRFSSFLLEVNKAWGIFTPSPSSFICLYTTCLSQSYHSLVCRLSRCQISYTRGIIPLLYSESRTFKDSHLSSICLTWEHIPVLSP